MKHVLARLIGSGHPRPDEPGPGAPRLHSATFHGAIYAIGDVHGRLDLLLGLEEKIAAHAREIEGEVWVIMLGDFVDRGPSSAQVVDHLLAAPAGRFRRICLGGNHEEAMLDALADPAAFAMWFGVGGAETLASYGLSPGRIEAQAWDTVRRTLTAFIPAAHRAFLATLPVLVQVPGFVLVHAGLRPGVSLAGQTDRDLRWIASDLEDGDRDFVVVHGHTIVPEVIVARRRIAVDTGAYETGRLSAVCLTGPGAPVAVIEQRG